MLNDLRMIEHKSETAYRIIPVRTLHACTHAGRLFSVVDQFRVQWLRDLADDEDGQGDNLFGVEGRKRSEDFVWTA
jgi:hypothetical protein